MEILSPVWPAVPTPRAPKQRPRGLQGVTVAMVDDNLDAPFTAHLESLLAEQAGAKVRRWVKPSGTAPSPASLIEEVAAEARVAVVGIAL
jgi:hypothetical protein